MSITSKCDWCGRTVEDVPGKVLVEATTTRMSRKHICFDCLRNETGAPTQPDMNAKEEEG